MGQVLKPTLFALGVLAAAAFARSSQAGEKSYSLSDNVQSHLLPGSPLSLRAGKGINFQRFQHGVSTGISSSNLFFTGLQRLFGSEGKRGSPRRGWGASTQDCSHYVVRVVRRDREAVRQSLLKAAAEANAVQYVPMDTFIAALTSPAAGDIAKLQGVEGVYHLPMEMKAPPELLQRLIPVEGARSRQRSWRFLDVSLGYSMPSQADTAALVAGWNEELQSLTGYETAKPIVVGSRRKVSLEAHDAVVHKALRFLLNQPQTLWVEERVGRSFKNKYATEIVTGQRLYVLDPEQDDDTGTSTGSSQNATSGQDSGADGKANSSALNGTWDKTGSEGPESVEIPETASSQSDGDLVANASVGNGTRRGGGSEENATGMGGSGDADAEGDAHNTSDSAVGGSPPAEGNASSGENATSGAGEPRGGGAAGDWREANGLWRRGMTGAGEVVGVCDSGLDVTSPFFADAEQEAPMCAQRDWRRRGSWYNKDRGDGEEEEGEEEECSSIDGRPLSNTAHRKVVGYRVHGAEASRADADAEHGTMVMMTMVAGSLAGAPQAPDPAQQERLQEYNGIAPEAKLAVDDVAMESWADGLPLDLVSDLWPWSYGLGARVHLNSWAVESVLYTQEASELDEFTYNHPDIAVVVAAGNFGPNAVTVLSPGTAKNAITVGASENDLDSYLQYSALEPEFMLERVPSNPDYEGLGDTVTPAAFGAQLRLSAPISGGCVLLGEAEGCGPVARGRMLRGKIAVAWAQEGCLHAEMVANLEGKGAAAVLILLRKERPGQRVLGRRGNPTIPAAYLNASAARVTADILGANPANGSVWVRFPVAWKQGPDALASFSSRGPTPDGRFKPDIVAPGDNIRTAAAAGHEDANAEGLRVATGSGTSLAAPFVAGAAAIIRQYFKEGRYDGASWEPSAALVKAMLLNSGVGLRWYYYFADWSLGYGQEVDGSVPTVEQGYGRVQLDRVLRFNDTEGGAEGEQPELLALDSEAVHHGEVHTVCVRAVPGGGGGGARPLKFTLAWTDPPASPTAWGLLINDLDLRVSTPGQELLMGNDLVAYNLRNKEHTVQDQTNPNEQVSVTSPVAGEYRAEIVGVDVPVGPQAFALAVTGQFEVVQCSDERKCPYNCSGVGACVEGQCECPLSRRGPGCEIHNVQLEPNREVQDMISSGGWSYYFFEASAGEQWQVRMQSTVTYADPDVFLAVDRLPTLSDHDAAHLYGPDLLVQQFSSSAVTLRERSTVVVGVNVYCCYHAGVKMTLLNADDGGDPGSGSDSEPDVPDKTPDPAPQYGDPEDRVSFRLSMPVSRLEFHLRETEYRAAVAAVANVQLQQVSIHYLWHRSDAVGDSAGAARRSRAAHTARGDLKLDIPPVTPDPAARAKALGPRGVLRRTGTRRLLGDGYDAAGGQTPGDELQELLVVGVELAVKAGTGHAVRFRLQGDAVNAELAQRELAVPLSVYAHAVEYFDPDEVAAEWPPEPVGSQDDYPERSKQYRGSKMTPIAVTLTCCVVVAMLSFAVLYLRRKGGWQQRGATHSSLVFVESGHTPGSPSAPEFVDASTAVRGLILGENGRIVLPQEEADAGGPEGARAGDLEAGAPDPVGQRAEGAWKAEGDAGGAGSPTAPGPTAPVWSEGIEMTEMRPAVAMTAEELLGVTPGASDRGRPEVGVTPGELEAGPEPAGEVAAEEGEGGRGREGGAERGGGTEP